MVCFPNAKINLGLNILEKRSDGFHNIETVFYPITLRDILEIIPSDTNETTLEIMGLEIPGDSNSNLCLKAYHLLAKDFELPGVNIYLQKLIPMGAGLGGGSSDGAFTLITLNLMFNLGLSEAQLTDYAGQLGSDCAFFIKNKPAIGEGKGNILKATEILLKGYYLALVKPDVHVGTAEAYAGVKPFFPEVTVGKTAQLPILSWKNKLVNDFEVSIFPKHAEIKYIKENLYDKGAIYSSMTGSGAAVYGIFESHPQLKEEFPNCFYWEGEL